jgi:hypothetical protein
MGMTGLLSTKSICFEIGIALELDAFLLNTLCVMNSAWMYLG